MSLPKFDLQGFLFESLGSIAPDLFGEKDKYKLVVVITSLWRPNPAMGRGSGVGPLYQDRMYRILW